MKEMKHILQLEVKRIHEAAVEGPLTFEDLKRLESVTKSWRTYFGTEINIVEDDLSSMSLDELLELAKG